MKTGVRRETEALVLPPETLEESHMTAGWASHRDVSLGPAPRPLSMSAMPSPVIFQSPSPSSRLLKHQADPADAGYKLLALIVGTVFKKHNPGIGP